MHLASILSVFLFICLALFIYLAVYLCDAVLTVCLSVLCIGLSLATYQSESKCLSVFMLVHTRALT